jgi:hypothetical protein
MEAKVAEQFGVASAGVVVVTDSNGVEIARGSALTGGGSSLLEQAIRKLDFPLAWEASFEVACKKAEAEGKGLVVLFEDGSEASKRTLEAMADWKLGKLREQLLFYKQAFDKSAPDELSKGWSISVGPSLVFLNLKDEEKDKQVVSKNSGAKTVQALATFLSKGIERLAAKKSGPSPFGKKGS